MPPRPVAEAAVDLVVLEAGPVPALAAGILAAHLGLAPGAAAARLAAAPGPLAEGLAPRAARQLAILLSLAGARVVPQGSAARTDLALHPVQGAAQPGVAGALAAALCTSAGEVERALASPEGLVLRGLSAADVALWRTALPRLPGLRPILSDPGAARYDLVALHRPADPAAPAALVTALARLGARRCPLTAALAADLDRATCEHLMRRFPSAGVVALDRAFQRFDLILQGSEGLGAADLRDFLATRGLGPGADGAVLERGLTRAHALAFQADYAAIGLRTRARLCGTRGA
jgi:hypothetical protein